MHVMRVQAHDNILCICTIFYIVVSSDIDSLFVSFAKEVWDRLIGLKHFQCEVCKYLIGSVEHGVFSSRSRCASRFVLSKTSLSFCLNAGSMLRRFGEAVSLESVLSYPGVPKVLFQHSICFAVCSPGLF